MLVCTQRIDSYQWKMLLNAIIIVLYKELFTAYTQRKKKISLAGVGITLTTLKLVL